MNRKERLEEQFVDTYNRHIPFGEERFFDLTSVVRLQNFLTLSILRGGTEEVKRERRQDA